MRLAVMSAAGNAFAVLDATRERPPADPAALARAVCADSTSALLATARERRGERVLDGLLLALAPRAGGDCRMVIHNADGSRPEACGNGLRCLARFAREHELVGDDVVRVETDAGSRTVELARVDGCIVAARATMGAPRVLGRAERLETPHGRVLATLVELGNPHCVLFVEDERQADVERLGPALETHARFPARTNVEFVARRGEGLAVRVWERGVGETAACGTGACAAAIAAALDGRVDLPVDVALPGGVLRVGWDGAGEAWLEGPCRLHAEGDWEPPRALVEVAR